MKMGWQLNESAVRGLRRGLFLVAGMVLAAIAVFAARLALDPDGPPAVQAIGGPFTLVDHDGRTVSDRDFQGRLLMVYFGFTNCPDMCPLAMQEVAVAMDALGPAAKDVQPLLITVDPERDTPPALKRYVAQFHPRILGLTGTKEQTDAAAAAYRVYAARAKGDSAEHHYSVDHTGLMYVMGKDGKYLAHFPSGTSGAAMAQRLRRWL
jgi:cytochrome oxidase Cu insertion factor (SCO1/SenC/PrrC family)